MPNPPPHDKPIFAPRTQTLTHAPKKSVGIGKVRLPDGVDTGAWHVEGTKPVRDREFPNLWYEGFSATERGYAQEAWRLIVQAAHLAATQFTKCEERMERWFGIFGGYRHTRRTLLDNLGKMAECVRQRRVTLVWRPTVMRETFYLGGDRGLERHEMLPIGRVWTEHTVGSGYRVLLNAATRVDQGDLPQMVRIIYHELTHKHIATDDVENEKGEVCYEVEKCQMLAYDYPEKAIRNADNYGLYIRSLLLHDSDPDQGKSRDARSQEIRELEAVTHYRRPAMKPPFDEAVLHILGQHAFGTYDYEQAERDATKICDPDTIPNRLK